MANREDVMGEVKRIKGQLEKNIKECEICKVPSTKFCTACKSVYYCDRSHQIQHWPFHRQVCLFFKERPVSSSLSSPSSSSSSPSSSFTDFSSPSSNTDMHTSSPASTNPSTVVFLDSTTTRTDSLTGKSSSPSSFVSVLSKLIIDDSPLANHLDSKKDKNDAVSIDQSTEVPPSDKFELANHV